jgi:hypothetical protein
MVVRVGVVLMVAPVAVVLSGKVMPVAQGMDLDHAAVGAVAEHQELVQPEPHQLEVMAVQELYPQYPAHLQHIRVVVAEDHLGAQLALADLAAAGTGQQALPEVRAPLIWVVVAVGVH